MSDAVEKLFERIAEADAVAAQGSLDDLKKEVFRQRGGPAGVVKALLDIFDTAESDQVRAKIGGDLFGLVVQSEKQAASKGPAEMSDEEIAQVMREAVPAFLEEMAKERFGEGYAARTIGEFLAAGEPAPAEAAA